MTKKRGSLFFIIDSFIAASIITLTIVMILSSHTETPIIDPARTAAENYLSFLQKNPLKHSSGTITQQIYNSGRIPNKQATLLQAIAYLYDKGDQYSASKIVEEQANKIIPSHIGMNFSINGTSIYTRKTERIPYADILVSAHAITTLITDPIINETTITISASDSNTQFKDYCSSGTECVSVISQSNEPHHCLDSTVSGITYNITCSSYKDSELIGPYEVEVQLWI